jgi:predicted transcriptional regulator
MRLKTTILLFCFSIVLFAKTENIDNLLEKLNQTSNVKEKKELLEKLKGELAQKNKEAREKADAILKAKEKIPTRLYEETPVKK